MKRLVLALMLILAPVTKAAAHHPGERIDEVMAEQEPDFEPTDLRRTPRLALTDVGGAVLDLGELEGKIVVLSFAAEGCGAPCEAQQTLLREVQEGVNVTPMREMVVFLTVAPVPASGPGWDDTNWQAVVAEDGAAEAVSFAALSERESDAPMVHVIARGGRHAGIFHGAEFGPVNLILYINELTRAPMPEPELLNRVLGVVN